MTIITPLIQMQQQIRIFHWQTHTHAEHIAFGNAYDTLNEQIDKFVETFIGKYGRPTAKITFNVELKNYADTNPLVSIDNYINFFIMRNK